MASSVTIEVLFFGQVKDVVGRSSETVEMPAGATLGDLFDRYAAQFPALAAMASSLVLAANQKFAARGRALAEGDEIALLPPVSGGAGPGYTHVVEDPEGHFFALTRSPIDTRELVARLRQGRDGAIATFEGVVRDNSNGRRTLFLEYEAYEAMAVETMARIGRELASKFEVSRIGMVHRLGRLEIGETSVVVAVSAPHRRPAFEACQEGINRLKKLVPVWKKEHFEDGAVWVEGAWDSSVVAG
jgi:molybdopterin converting factor subunit 1